MQTIALKRSQQLLNFSIQDDFQVTGAVRFFGRLPHSMPFDYESRFVFFKSLDGEFFIRFHIHPKKKRILVCTTSNSDSIDLYFYNPSFEYALHKAMGIGRKRLLPNGTYSGWGDHVIKAWENISKDFSEHGIQFTEDSLRKILQATIERSIY